MSSTRPHPPSQPSSSTSSSEPTARKKFGKNLNKLTKPPAPPIATSSGIGGGAGATGGRGASSRNGLLLLSTKRSSSSSQSVSSSGGGLLSGHKSSFSAPKPLNTPSLRSECSTSAHDALLTAAAAAAGRFEQPQVPQQPQAWGLGEKQQRPAAPTPSSSAQTVASSPAKKNPNPPVLAPNGRRAPSGHRSASSSNQDVGIERRNQEESPKGRPQGTMEVPNGPPSRLDYLPGSSVRSSVDSQFLAPSIGDVAAGGRAHPSTGETREVRTKPEDDWGSPSNIVPRRGSYGSGVAGNEYSPLATSSDSKEVIGRPTARGRFESEQNLCEDTQRQPYVEGRRDLISKGKLSGIVTDSQSVKVAEQPIENGGTGDEKDHDQVKYMSRLAKERAEKRRAEEEARMNEQRERASRRLKELEKKMSTVTSTSSDRGAPKGGSAGQVSTTSTTDPNSTSLSVKADLHPVSVDVPTGQTMTVVALSDHSNCRQPMSKVGNGTVSVGSLGVSYQQKSEIVLERLGRTKKAGAGTPNKLSPGTSGSASTSVNPKGAGHGGRTLFDPNRSYSSLVGGSVTPHRSGSSTKPDDGSKPLKLESNLHAPTQIVSRDLPQNHEPGPHSAGGMTAVSDDQPPISVIQLSSYEDRDRGERHTSSGPRMLFDPKSGSMVAVPSRDETTSGSRGRKERNKPKGRNGREREIKDRDEQVGVSPITIAKRSASAGISDGHNRSTTSIEMGVHEQSDSKTARRQKGRRDDSAGQRKERKRGDRDGKANAVTAGTDPPKSGGFDDSGVVHGTGNKARHSAGRTASSKYQPVVEPPRIPRTCGVLYKVDESGNYICADGCEADQGYGAHSVPGGRVMNPVAHANFLEQQKRHQHEVAKNRGAFRRDHVVGVTGYYGEHIPGVAQQQQELNVRGQRRFDSQQRAGHRQQPYYADYETAPERVPALDNHRPVAAEYMVSSRDGGKHLAGDSGKEETYDTYDDIPSPLRVKPNEKIELLTGEPDSPTLQATANPWAPSEAALAAAAAASAAKASSTLDLDMGSPARDDVSENGVGTSAIDLIIADSDEDSSDDNDLQGSPSFVGLGFDPTENMDSVMMSPSLRSDAAENKKVVAVGLADLSLGTSGATDSGSTNPFGPLGTPSRFLGSSTWGTGTSLTRSPGGDSSLLANWDILGAANGEAASASAQTSNSTGQKKPVTAASFLSLSPLSVHHDSKTWGISGLGGTPLTGSHSASNGPGQTTD